jgi:hypothetical protein
VEDEITTPVPDPYITGSAVIQFAMNSLENLPLPTNSDVSSVIGNKLIQPATNARGIPSDIRQLVNYVFGKELDQGLVFRLPTEGNGNAPPGEFWSRVALGK